MSGETNLSLGDYKGSEDVIARRVVRHLSLGDYKVSKNIIARRVVRQTCPWAIIRGVRTQ